MIELHILTDHEEAKAAKGDIKCYGHGKPCLVQPIVKLFQMHKGKPGITVLYYCRQSLHERLVANPSWAADLAIQASIGNRIRELRHDGLKEEFARYQIEMQNKLDDLQQQIHTVSASQFRNNGITEVLT